MAARADWRAEIASRGKIEALPTGVGSVRFWQARDVVRLRRETANFKEAPGSVQSKGRQLNWSLERLSFSP